MKESERESYIGKEIYYHKKNSNTLTRIYIHTDMDED